MRSALDGPQGAEGIALLEEFDGWSTLRNRVHQVGQKMGEWAGIPLPIEGEDLIIEPSYGFANALMKEEKPEREIPPEDRIEVRNLFWSTRWRREVVVFEHQGRVRHMVSKGVGNLDTQLRTLGCTFAWGIEQEARALQLLGTLLRHHIFKQYLLCGTFLESSRRSGITYMFRKLRPTIAISTQGDKLRPLCALCMHPIAYYGGSWAGAMCPTDDVIAHLMLMRGDEPMLWRRSSQHPLDRPEAGV